jgi:hypothetical protein
LDLVSWRELVVDLLAEPANSRHLTVRLSQRSR